jgi:hypothetical protein
MLLPAERIRECDLDLRGEARFAGPDAETCTLPLLPHKSMQPN